MADQAPSQARPPAGAAMVEGLPAFRRRMARFELQQARRRLAEGRPDRAAVALRRALLWRAASHLAHSADPNLSDQRGVYGAPLIPRPFHFFVGMEQRKPEHAATPFGQREVSPMRKTDSEPQQVPTWLSQRALKDRWSMSTTTLYRHLKNGAIPQPEYPFGPGKPLWRVKTIEAFELRTAPPEPAPAMEAAS